MEIAVVGAGVGRTGTHSLKVALEQLLDGPCHHMVEVLGDPSQVPAWIDAIEGRPVDWSSVLARYRSIVDWPGGAFWPELAPWMNAVRRLLRDRFSDSFDDPTMMMDAFCPSQRRGARRRIARSPP